MLNLCLVAQFLPPPKQIQKFTWSHTTVHGEKNVFLPWLGMLQRCTYINAGTSPASIISCCFSDVLTYDRVLSTPKGIVNPGLSSQYSVPSLTPDFEDICCESKLFKEVVSGEPLWDVFSFAWELASGKTQARLLTESFFLNRNISTVLQTHISDYWITFQDLN